MKRYAWIIYLAMNVVLAVFYMTRPPSSVDPSIYTIQTHVVHGAAWGAVLAIGLGMLLWKPKYKMPWVFLLLAHISFALAFTSTFFVQRGQPGWMRPDIPDLFFLGFHPFMLVSLVTFIWKRDSARDRIAFCDALIVGLGVASVLFRFSIEAALDAPHQIPGNALTETAYIVFILLDFIAVIRLIFTASRKHFSYWMLFLSVIAFLFTNAAMSYYGEINPNLSYGGLPVRWLNYFPTLVFFASSGLIALHPTMNTLADEGIKNVLWTPIWRRVAVIVGSILPVALTTLYESQFVNYFALVVVVALIVRCQLLINGLRRTTYIVREGGLELERQQALRDKG